MDADEREICEFLKTFPGQFISPREVARRAGGKWKFHDDQHWAIPVLVRLKEKNLVESNASGQFRLVGNLKKEKQKKWISPHIKKILEQSGKDFSEAVGEGGEGVEGESGAGGEQTGNPKTE